MNADRDQAIATLRDMVSQSEEWDAHKIDFFGDIPEAQFIGRDAIVGGVRAPVTRHALSHLCDIITPMSKKRLPFKYLADDAPDGIVGQVLSAHKDHIHNAKTVMFRAYRNQVRAVVGEKWPRFGTGTFGHGFENTWILKLLLDTAIGSDFVALGRTIHTEDELVIKIGFAEENFLETNGNMRRNYGGVVVANSEAKRRSLKCYPFVHTLSCQNDLVVDSDWSVNLSHVGNAQRFITAVQNALMQAAPNSAYVAALMQRAQSVRVNMSDHIQKMARDYAWGDKIMVDIGIGAGQGGSLLNLIDGITYAAHQEGVNPEDGLKMEFIAGALLQPLTGKKRDPRAENSMREAEREDLVIVEAVDAE